MSSSSSLPQHPIPLRGDVRIGPTPVFLAAITFILQPSTNKHFEASEMLAVLIAYSNQFGSRGKPGEKFTLRKHSGSGLQVKRGCS